MSTVFSSMNRTRGSRAAAALLAVVLIGSGCGTKSDQSGPGDDTDDNSVQVTQDSCRARLDTATRRLNPSSLSAITRLKAAVGALNAWLVDCAADDLREVQASEANLAFLDVTAQRAVLSPRFTARDAACVRDSLIASRLSQSIVTRTSGHDAETDTDRIIRIFRWVGINIALESAAETGVVKGFLDTLLTGRGSVRSRVWVLAVLLRQLQRDAVILLPADSAGEPEDASEFLISVCLDDRMLLFDPHAWLPVPDANDNSVRVNRPAGAEFLEADERWNSPQILIVAETSNVCPRMLLLQEQLPAESSAILYEELAGGTSEDRPLTERVTAAAVGVFMEENIRWWGWPDQQATAAIARDEQQRRKYDALVKPFEAPFEREPLELGQDFNRALTEDLTQAQREHLWGQRMQMEYDRIQQLVTNDNLDKLFGRPSGRLLKTRLAQVKGGRDRTIIQQLQKIQNACLDDAIRFAVPKRVDPTGERSIRIPDAILTVNRQATGSSLYWIAICQMDRSKPGTAITGFQSYRRQNPDGAWFYSSLMNQAISELEQGRRKTAAETLMKADHESNPDRRQAAILLQRLQAAMASEAEPTDDLPHDVAPADTAREGVTSDESASAVPDSPSSADDPDTKSDEF